MELGVEFENCFMVYSCSCLTFILYVSVNSWGPNGLFFGLGQVSTTVLGYIHIVEQLSFSMFLSILRVDFDLIFRSFLISGGPNGLFLGLGKGSKTVMGSTHVVDQPLFTIVP